MADFHLRVCNLAAYCFFLCCCCCLPNSLLCAPTDQQENPPISKQHPCTIRKTYFLQTFMKKNIFTLAEQARIMDKDTDNKLFGSYLFFGIKEKDHCYLMKNVVSSIVENVLHDNSKKYPHIDNAIVFLLNIQKDLAGCKSEEEDHIRKNVEQMINKMKMMGPNGKNKVVGELDLLFGHLRKCTLQRMKPHVHK
ncbi:interleukin-22-like [Xenopus laevis]|uniref:Interleukin-22-like n=1 Tax=Xenopus laevis TaxID=8355 RepID=A0A8J0UNA7_XENLA|nr:interleukin-22-like [Xenopus laevis]